MAWTYLLIAGMFEIAFTSCLTKLKDSSGTAALMWLAAFLVAMTLSLYFLYKATLTLPMGTAYAVWTGIGAAGTVLMGIFFFKEPSSIWRLFFLCTLIGSIAGLKYVAGR